MVGYAYLKEATGFQNDAQPERDSYTARVRELPVMGKSGFSAEYVYVLR